MQPFDINSLSDDEYKKLKLQVTPQPKTPSQSGQSAFKQSSSSRNPVDRYYDATLGAAGQGIQRAIGGTVATAGFGIGQIAQGAAKMAGGALSNISQATVGAARMGSSLVDSVAGKSEDNIKFQQNKITDLQTRYNEYRSKIETSVSDPAAKQQQLDELESKYNTRMGEQERSLQDLQDPFGGVARGAGDMVMGAVAGVGDTFGGAGQAALGAGATALSTTAGGLSATYGLGSDIGKAVLPDQTDAFESGAKDFGMGLMQGAVGAMKSAGEGVTNAYKALGYSEEDAKRLANQSASAIDAIPFGLVTKPGRTALKAGAKAIGDTAAAQAIKQMSNSGIRSISESAAGVMAKKVASDFSYIMSSPKGAAASWINRLGEASKVSTAKFFARVGGTEIDDVALNTMKGGPKKFADAYFAERAAHLTSQFPEAAKNIKLAANVSSFAWNHGVKNVAKVAGVGANFMYGPNKVIWELTKKGATTAMKLVGPDGVSAVTRGMKASDDLLKAYGQVPVDLTGVMKRNKDFVQSGVLNVSEAVEVGKTAVEEAITKSKTFISNVVDTAEGKISSFRASAASAAGHIAAVGSISDNLIKTGKGSIGAYYEHSRRFFEGALQDIVEGGTKLTDELGNMAKQIPVDATVGTLRKIQQRLSDILKGTDVDPKDLSVNRDLVRSLHANVTKDLETTLGGLDDGLKSSLDASRKNMQTHVSDLWETMKTKLSNGIPVEKVVEDEYLKYLVGATKDGIDELGSEMVDASNGAIQDMLLMWAIKHKDNADVMNSPIGRGVTNSLDDDGNAMLKLDMDYKEDGIWKKTMLTFDAMGKKIALMFNATDYTKSKAVQLVMAKTERNFNDYGLITGIDPESIKTWVSGDLPEIDDTLEMVRLATAQMGRTGGAGVLPADVALGGKFVSSMKTLQDMQAVAGTKLEQARIAAQDLSIPIDDVSMEFMESLKNVLDVQALSVDPSGNVKFVLNKTSPILGNSGAKRKLETLMTQLNAIVDIDGATGAQTIKYKSIEKVRVLIGDMPGYVGDTGTSTPMKDTLNEIVSAYEKGLIRSLYTENPQLGDLETLYATVMGSKRSFESLAGITTKNVERKFLNFKAEDGKSFVKVLDPNTVKKMVEGARKLAGKSPADWKQMFDRVGTVVSKVEGGSSSDYMEQIHRIIEREQLVHSILGNPQVTTRGNEALHTGYGLQNMGFGSAVVRMRSEGWKRTAFGMLSGDFDPMEQMGRLNLLLRGQRQLVEETGQAYIRDPLNYAMPGMRNFEDSYSALYNRSMVSPEETRMGNEYTEEAGTKALRFTRPSQTNNDSDVDMAQALKNMETGDQGDDPTEMPF